MPRQARGKSESGVYHIMIRGINQQIIFEDDEDQEKYLQLLRFYRKRCGFALYGYCLMDNHVHLLVKEAARPSIVTIMEKEVEAGPGERLESVFKRIGVSYVRYFNRKYKRVGHLFQDRYRSEAIDEDAYLLMALRYIHRNPVKAGICARPEEYQGSSYRAYLEERDDGLVDTGFALSLLTGQHLRAYTEQESDDRFIDVEKQSALSRTDEEARLVMRMLTGCANTSEFQKLPRQDRDGFFRQLYQKGINIAQIGRITGYSRPLVYRALEA